MFVMFRLTLPLFLLINWAAACQTVPGALPAAPLSGVNAAPFTALVQPDAGSQSIVGLLNSAQKTIRMVMYVLTDREIVDALKAARGRGVDVRVILEAQPTESGAANRSTTADLETANITVRTGNPAHRNTRQKTIVVDDRAVLIMTFNQTRASFTTNRGYAILDVNPDDVAEIVNVFEADWQRVARA
jgi:phosphatidylserine/phosphatidylglycerophosphate/cardiolipin synthase-like enzyme